jgi:hypothetical protein
VALDEHERGIEVWHAHHDEHRPEDLFAIDPHVEYGGNLEVFVEKTLAERFAIRLAAQNLLDSDKDEIQRIYESVDQLNAGTPVATVHQNEESDPSYILTLRGTL